MKKGLFHPKFDLEAIYGTNLAEKLKERVKNRSSRWFTYQIKGQNLLVW